MAATHDESLLEAALDYAGRGWHVLPVAGKKPRLSGWEEGASRDMVVARGWWEGEFAGHNIGVQLGPRSGIIDLECDTAQGEADLLALFDGDPPVTPTFQSVRGKHRLFRWHEGFAGRGGVFKWRAIEVRCGADGKGAQSVFPPSRHPDGSSYEWLIGPDEASVAILPPAAVFKLLGSPERPGAKSSNGKPAAYGPGDVIYEGERNNEMHRKACSLLRQTANYRGVEVLMDAARLGWMFDVLRGLNQIHCRPPLAEAELGRLFDNARQFVASEAGKEQAARDEQACGQSLIRLGLEYRDGEWWPGKWSAQVEDSDPPQMLLVVPFWADPIAMSVEEFDDPKRVHKAVLRATGNVCLYDRPLIWPSVWDGCKPKGRPPQRGVKAKLLDHVQRVDAPPQTKPLTVLAGHLLAALHTAIVETEQLPIIDTELPAFRMLDGTYLIRIDLFRATLVRAPDKFAPREVENLFRLVGAKREERRLGGSATKLRFRVLDQESLRKLEVLADG